MFQLFNVLDHASETTVHYYVLLHRYEHYVPKSSYKSRVVSNFYGTEIEIGAGFGPVGTTEKKWGPIHLSALDF